MPPQEKPDLTPVISLTGCCAEFRIALQAELQAAEKLIFVDNTLLWSGSLNPLSFSNTQEIMERRESSEVVEDYGTKLLLEDLLHACDAGEMHCPVCGSEVVTAEGKDVPIYFRCIVDGCFSRNVGDPMPSSGSLVCSSCGGELQFGKWGDDFAWRCIANPRHHMRIHAHHLKLPPMLALIPAGKRKAVLRSLGVPVALPVEPPTEEQPLLFTLPIEGEPDWCHD